MSGKKFPAVDTMLCVKCCKCIAVCPSNAINARHDLSANNYSCAKCVKYCMTMDVPCKPVTIFFLYDNCDACGECISVCEYGAIYTISPQEAYMNSTARDKMDTNIEI